MKEKDFFEQLEQKAYTQKDKALFKKAVQFSKRILSDKKRLSGDSFFDHNLRVALALSKNKASPETIVAAIVHGTIKYISEEELEKEFDKEILSLVKGVEEITSIKEKNEKLTADSIRRVLLATVRDVRIIFIKLADKLDNLRDLHVLEKEKQRRIAQEIIDIYAPLAYRLGAERLRTELEDLAFKNLKPKKYEEIFDYIENTQDEQNKLIHSLIAQLQKDSQVKIVKVKGRSKHLYSIYKKITERGISLDDQYDYLGIRAIVESEKDCYILLAYLHEHFEVISGRLKDYIANPKPNGYQSIHTSLLIDGKKRLEVQIRTPEMDEFAEEGLAAHWMYKGLKSDYAFEKRMAWLKGVLDMQKDADDREFLENVKVDIFTDEIHCYTPKGDVKYFPKGSTVLDFAYSVHEDVGNKTIGARINGKFVNIKTKLEEGAVIEILTSKKQLPRRNWLKFVVSSRAKQKIRRGVKKYQNLPALHYRTFKPTIKEEHASLVESEAFPNASCVLAKCCHPIPQESIVGIATKRRLISVHRENCRHAEKERDRWEAVQWKESFNKKISFHVEANERSGLLADLLHTIAQAHFQVEEAKAKFLGAGHSQCTFVIVPREIDEIEKLVARLLKLKGVRSIHFD